MTEDPTTRYAVIVVNYGDPSLIAANLGRDIAEDSGALVVVVDNFHSDEHRRQARDLCHDRRWLFVASANDGFGAGVNRGVSAALLRGHRAFITLNPDAQASAEVLSSLAQQVSENPRCLVSPFMDTSDGHPHFRGIRVHARTGQMRSGWSPGDADPEWKNWLSGACLAFSADAFAELGGFREDFFLYWEDVDISRRAAELGMTLELREDLLVVHDEGGTQDARSSRTKSHGYYYYNVRNRLLFGRGLLRGRAWMNWLVASPRQSALIWMRGGRRQAFTDPRGLAAAVRGFFAGLAATVTTSRKAQVTSALPGPTTSGATGASDDAQRPTLTIAIPTFHRPEILTALLAELPARIAETPGTEVDVLVIDNDPEGSARQEAEAAPVAVRYMIERTPGIAAVRNRALDECQDRDLLAFIDDDEIPRPEWLSALVEVWEQNRCSAVMGRVVSLFDEDVDPWVVAAGTFFRPERPTGTHLSVAATGNLLLDLQQVRDLGVRFDETLGLGGGEDVLFSQELVARGGTIVWCNESVTEDPVVASRLTREWARERAFSSANGLVHTELRRASGTLGRMSVRGKSLAGGLARIVVGHARHCYGVARHDLVHDARGVRLASRGRGMVAGALGHHFQAYARS